MECDLWRNYYEEIIDNFKSSFADDLHEVCELAMIYLLPADFVEKVLGLEELEEEFGKINHEQGASMIAYVPREIYKQTG